MKERERWSQTWEAARCFHMDEPTSSGKNTSHKKLLVMLSNHWQIRATNKQILSTKIISQKLYNLINVIKVFAISSSCDTQNNTKSHGSNGHVLPLVVWLQATEPILILLATRENKLCWLLNQAPCHHPPQFNVHTKIPNISNPNNCRQKDKPPRRNLKKLNPNSKKGTDDPKHGKRPNAFMWMNQQAQARMNHAKYCR